MSDIQASSVSLTSGGLSAAGGATPIRRPANVGGESNAAGAPAAGASRSDAAIRLETATNQTYAASASSRSLVVEQSAEDDMLAMLVMLLVQFLLGDQEDDKKDRNEAIAGLMGLMLLSSLGEAASSQSTDRFSYFESQTSQFAQSITTTNTSVVQAASYNQAAGSAGDGDAPLGGQLDITA